MTGPRGVLVAALLGGPLYTPTLIEVVLGKALMDHRQGDQVKVNAPAGSFVVTVIKVK